MPGSRDRPCCGTENNVYAMERSCLPRSPVIAMPRGVNGIAPALTACLVLGVPELLRSKIP